MIRKVRTRPSCEADLRRIARSIIERVSEESALRWSAKLRQAIDSLSEDADRWPEADESGSLGINLRFRIAGRGKHIYRILFTIEGDRVIVHRVLHAAQDWITDLD